MDRMLVDLLKLRWATAVCMACLGTAMLMGAMVALLPANAQADRPKRADRVQVLHFHGWRVDDVQGRQPLANPDRGFRLEMRLAQPSRGTMDRPLGRGASLAEQFQQFEEHRITLTQGYIYLTAYRDRPLSDQQLQRIAESFDELRQMGMKVVLRFAYQRDVTTDDGAPFPIIMQHIEQLTPVLREHADIIHVLQAGFVGAWGEWHNCPHDVHRNPQALSAIMSALLDALPRHQVQVRLPRYKRDLLGDDAWLEAAQAHGPHPAARIGFHNDYFLARPHRWDIREGTTDFEQFDRESPFLLIDGEMPWGDDEQAGGMVDGLDAAERLLRHRYTSFSITHSLRTSIAQWKQTELTLAEAQGRGLSISDGYFEDVHGRPQARTVFEYIRDHLGYRLEGQHATLPRHAHVGEQVSLSLSLINRGFSTLHHARPVVWVLVDGQDRVIELATSDVDVRHWQPHVPADAARTPLKHEIATEATLHADLPAGEYRVGLWLPDGSQRLGHDARFAIELANRDVTWWTCPHGKYGVNLLGVMQIHDQPQ